MDFLQVISVLSLIAHDEEWEALPDKLGNLIIIGFFETWLKPLNEEFYALPGYSIYAQSWSSHSGGVIDLCLRHDSPSAVRPDPTDLIAILEESVFVELKNYISNKSITVREIYHPPAPAPTNRITS